MKLADFMKDRGLDDAAMAVLIGEASEGAVKKWRYGERTPRPNQMTRITAATAGAVTANDFMPTTDAAANSFGLGTVALLETPIVSPAEASLLVGAQTILDADLGPRMPDEELTEVSKSRRGRWRGGFLTAGDRTSGRGRS